MGNWLVSPTLLVHPSPHAEKFTVRFPDPGDEAPLPEPPAQGQGRPDLPGLGGGQAGAVAEGAVRGRGAVHVHESGESARFLREGGEGKHM